MKKTMYIICCLGILESLQVWHKVFKKSLILNVVFLHFCCFLDFLPSLKPCTEIQLGNVTHPSYRLPIVSVSVLRCYCSCKPSLLLHRWELEKSAEWRIGCLSFFFLPLCSPLSDSLISCERKCKERSQFMQFHFLLLSSLLFSPLKKKNFTLMFVFMKKCISGENSSWHLEILQTEQEVKARVSRNPASTHLSEPSDFLRKRLGDQGCNFFLPLCLSHSGKSVWTRNPSAIALWSDPASDDGASAVSAALELNRPAGSSW